MTQHEKTPQEHTLDNSLALLKDGYDFIFKRRREMDTELFRTRLLGQPAISMGGSPFDLIPQGGGDPNFGHRCAGEWLTIDTMRVGLEFLAKRLTYEVPEQDLGLSLSRMPALPESRFKMRNVRLTP